MTIEKPFMKIRDKTEKVSNFYEVNYCNNEKAPDFSEAGDMIRTNFSIIHEVCEKTNKANYKHYFILTIQAALKLFGEPLLTRAV